MKDSTIQGEAISEELIKRAEQGNAEDQSLLGDQYFKARDYKKAFKWYSKAALKGFAEAQFQLGIMYQEGQAGPQNYEKAAHWFFKAAVEGHAKAQYALGIMYHVGDGIPQDYLKAFKWYSKAAEQGHADAQFRLGLMYHIGSGVAQNNILRYLWFNLAVAHGHPDAIKLRNSITKTMTPEEIAKAQQKSTEWLTQHSK